MYRRSIEFISFMVDDSSDTISSLTSETTPRTRDLNTPLHPPSAVVSMELMPLLLRLGRPVNKPLAPTGGGSYTTYEVSEAIENIEQQYEFIT